MTELDPAVLPVVMPLVRRFLESAESATRDDLIAALTPAGLVQRADDDRSRHVGPSVRALESLGILELRDGTLRLATPGLDESAFRLEVARRLLRVPDGVDPWQARANAQRLEYDLEVAVVWFCLQGLTPALRDFDSPTAACGLNSAEKGISCAMAPRMGRSNDGWSGWASGVGWSSGMRPHSCRTRRPCSDQRWMSWRREESASRRGSSWTPRRTSFRGCRTAAWVGWWLRGSTRCPMTAPSIIGFPPAYPWRLCDSRGAEMSSSGPVTIRARGSRSELRAAVGDAIAWVERG